MKANDQGDPCDPASSEGSGLFRAIFEQAAVRVAQIESATGRYPRINSRPCDLVCSVKEETEP